VRLFSHVFNSLAGKFCDKYLIAVAEPKYSKTPIFHVCGDHIKVSNFGNILLMGDLARAIQKVHKIAENAEYGNVKSEFYGIRNR